MYANIVNNYTKSKFSIIFPICLFKYISPKRKIVIFGVSRRYFASAMQINLHGARLFVSLTSS